MPRIDVHSERQIRGFIPRPDAVLISISSAPEPVEVLPGWHEILRLRFHDISKDPREVPLAEEQILFTPEHAHSILEFVEKHRGRDIAVHCAAGISRSVAVGECLSEFFDEYELHLHAVKSTQYANPLIRRIFHRILWERTNE